MGCCGGDREKGVVLEEQKWHYITLDDFKSRSCITRFSYGWLWFLAIVSIAVYAVDTFTAVNLLAFNRWSSQVKPAVPFNVSKWIFAVCILLSWVLLGFEYIRAIRVIRRGGVAESYMDPLAVVLQSMRPGSGKGYRRFLVFAELTKSKKGVDYLALFVYFAFKGAIRVLLAEAPRQFVNGMTLYSVSKADLLPAGQHAAGSALGQFFQNIKILANTESKQAVILGSMLFTFFVWVLSALALFFALLFYLFFLWHYVPASDGRLSVYCRRKINQRLGRIVSNKVVKALEDQERKERKQQLREDREAMKKGLRPTAQRQPTLPTLDDEKDDKYAGSILSRSTSQSTLPPYTPRNGNNAPTLQRQPTLPDINEDAVAPAFTRMNTTSSSLSVDSDAPLLSDPGAMGASEPVRKPLPNSRDNYGRPIVNRNMSSASQVSRPSPATPAPSYHSNGYKPDGLSRQTTQGSIAPTYAPPTRTNTQESFGRPYAPARQNTGFSSLSSPLSSGDSYELSLQTPIKPQQSPVAERGYTPFNPNRSAAGTPRRDVTSPASFRQQQQSPADYFTPRAPQRSATDPSYRPSAFDDYPSGSPAPAGAMPSRSATAGPGMQQGQGGYPAPRMGPAGMGSQGRWAGANGYAPRGPM
ncbi:MAG: hypothetical protein M1821_003967 [Bathelium mastoideum]|nr:MAG: hypothetical protein M1821_003967 [Bathelium mastoideum]KAI9691041.1 MAG: hypothetical protein M1822_008661 [Bathelium mastoideum]